MKIRSAVPENGCLIFAVGKKQTVKHLRIRPLAGGGCVNDDIGTNVRGKRSSQSRVSLHRMSHLDRWMRHSKWESRPIVGWRLQ